MRNFAFLLVLLCACRAIEPSNAPEEVCKRSCAKSAKACEEDQCARGCTFIIDRVIERETDRVVACVDKRKARGCGDAVWAECAASVGPHADGGPPAPPPPDEDSE